MISLKQSCINVIANKFDRFHFAFCVTNDEILMSDLMFLQRFFTSELGSELCKKGKMKDEYLDFLMNEHLNILDENWFVDSFYLYLMKDNIDRFPNLTKVSLANTCNDEILKKIAEFCPHVVEINASNRFVTDTGLKYLCKNEKGKVPCTNLKELTIGKSSVTDEGLAYLIQNFHLWKKFTTKEFR